MFASNRSAKRLRMRARSCTDSPLHTPLSNARCAASTARLTSASPAAASAPIARPVAGLTMSIVRPLMAGVSLPSINSGTSNGSAGFTVMTCLPFYAAARFSKRRRGSDMGQMCVVVQSRVACGDFFQATTLGLDAPYGNDDDLQQQQRKHHCQHAGNAVVAKQPYHREGREDGGTATEGVADARRAQTNLGRKQLRYIDAEQQGHQHVHRNHQQQAD